MPIQLPKGEYNRPSLIEKVLKFNSKVEKDPRYGELVSFIQLF